MSSVSESEGIYERIVSGINDKARALRALRLNNAVIRKFGDQITLEDFLAQAREAITGSEYALNHTSDQDSDIIRDETKRVATHWLRNASVGKPSLMDHPDLRISKFGRRMYLELNPDQLMPEKLADLKKEWGI